MANRNVIASLLLGLISSLITCLQLNLAIAIEFAAKPAHGLEVQVANQVGSSGDINVRDTYRKDPSEYRNLRHFHFLHWPEDGNPWSGQTILQLICKVDSWEKEVKVFAKPFEVIGPIVVHCNYGIGRTGVYCLLHTMYHQITREKTVSLYQMARLYNHQRPHCVSSKEHYEFCYDTLVEYIEADCSLHLV